MLDRKRAAAALVGTLLLASCSGGGDPAGLAIGYDAEALLEGNKIVFDGSQNGDAGSFRWSYRRAGDEAFTPIACFDGRSRIPVIFAAPGEYAIRLSSDGANGTVELTVQQRDIDLSTFVVDAQYAGAFRLTRSADGYDVAVRLNDELLGLIRADTGVAHRYFDVYLQDVNGNTCEGGTASYLDDGENVSVSPQLGALAGIHAPDVPDVIPYGPLTAETATLIRRVEHLITYVSDVANGEQLPAPVLQIRFVSSEFFLVVPAEPPDEFYLVY